VAALASAAGPTWDDVRYALIRDTLSTENGDAESANPHEAFALVSFR
jgi:hypothetical protein